ncbi:putative E3 ubiquitin-protein ligase MARCHF10 isoform 6-T7 [Thomomys bottae]
MLHEARDRQKFVNDVQYLRDMQHKVDSEYQACLRRHEFKKDPSEKKRDQFWGQDTSERSWHSSGSSSKQSVSEAESLTEPRYTKLPSTKCDDRLPAIDPTPIKQKHKSTMTPKKPEKAGPSKPSPAQYELLLPAPASIATFPSSGSGTFYFPPSYHLSQLYHLQCLHHSRSPKGVTSSPLLLPCLLPYSI